MSDSSPEVPLNPPPTPPVSSEAATDKAKRLGLIAAAHAKRFAMAVVAKVKAATLFTLKQVERVRIAKYSIPRAYSTLGKDVYQGGRYREEFAQLFGEIDVLTARIKSLREVKPVESQQKFLEKVKAAAVKATNVANAQAVALKANGPLRQLGKMVFEKHGAESGPQPLVAPILQCQSRTTELETEIRSLEKSHADGAFTPRRVAIGSGVLLVLAVLLGVIGTFSRDNKQVASSAHAKQVVVSGHVDKLKPTGDNSQTKSTGGDATLDQAPSNLTTGDAAESRTSKKSENNRNKRRVVSRLPADVFKEPFNSPVEPPTVGPLKMGIGPAELPAQFQQLDPEGLVREKPFEKEIAVYYCDQPKTVGGFPDYVDAVLAYFAGDRLYKVVYKVKLVHSDLSPEMLAQMGIDRNLPKSFADTTEKQIKESVQRNFRPYNKPFADRLDFTLEPFSEVMTDEQFEALKLFLNLASGDACAGLFAVRVEGGVKAPRLYKPFIDNRDSYWVNFRKKDLFVVLQGQEWETLGQPGERSGIMQTRWLHLIHIWMPFEEHYGMEFAALKSSELESKVLKVPKTNTKLPAAADTYANIPRVKDTITNSIGMKLSMIPAGEFQMA